MFLAITNRSFVRPEAYLNQIEAIAKAGPDGIILREKDLSRDAYNDLAGQCLGICRKYEVPLIVNGFADVAGELGIQYLHLPASVFFSSGEWKKRFDKVGVSVHSVDEAKKAEACGADYMIAGHIFRTDCKKGISPRGLAFLKEVCGAVNVPVFAIGGIDSKNGRLALNAGAEGVCMMSEVMKSGKPEELIRPFAEKGKF